MLASRENNRENGVMTTMRECEIIFQEIDAALQHDLQTDNTTIGLSATDLIGVATFANQAQRSDILRIVHDTAFQQHEAAGQGAADKQVYRAVGRVVSCLLYANRDPLIDESPSIDQNDFRVYRAYKPEV